MGLELYMGAGLKRRYGLTSLMTALTVGSLSFILNLFVFVPPGPGPKPYEFMGFGDLHGPKPYEFIGFGDTKRQRTGVLFFTRG